MLVVVSLVVIVTDNSFPQQILHIWHTIFYSPSNRPIVQLLSLAPQLTDTVTIFRISSGQYFYYSFRYSLSSSHVFHSEIMSIVHIQ